jgi:GDP-4-dehydro-6-deoxy-D-mannose reductase
VNGPVLITGAAGFAGSHLLDLLAGRHELAAWSRSSPPADRRGMARWQQVDLLDRDATRAAVRTLRPSVVYHCAGTAHVAESFTDTVTPLANNVLGTHHLFDALRRASLPCRIVLTGSALVYGRSDEPLRETSSIAPASPYAVSKLAQEQLGLRALAEDGLSVIVARPFNHTGPRQKPSFMAPGVARQIATIERGDIEPVLRVGNLDAVRDLSDVRDVVRAYAALMESGTPGEVYNVASGAGHTMREVLEALVSRSSVPIRIDIDPARFRRNDTPVLVGDAGRLREATGWSPQVSFDRMLDDLLAYWRSVRA